MNSPEALAEWLHTLLGVFADIDESDREALSRTLDNVSPPCQVDAVWFAVPDLNVNCQAFIFSRFADMEHGLITVHGPAHPSQASEILKTLVSHPKWERPITGRSAFALRDPSYPRLLEVPIHQLLAHIKGAVLTRAFQQALEPPVPRRASAARLTDHLFYWVYAGNLADQPAEDLARDILEEARGHAVSSKRTAERPAQVRPVTEPGFGTYLYPPVWIGELPIETSEQRLWQSVRNHLPMGASLWADEALTAPYKGALLVAMQDGFVAIKESNREKALRMLNEIMAIGVLAGLDIIAVREHELAEVEFSDNKIVRQSTPISSIRMVYGTQVMPGSEATPEGISLTRRVIASADLKRIVHLAEQNTTEPVPALPLLLEAHSALQDSEYPQSYIMSWAIIEYWIEARWKTFLEQERDLSGSRIGKLTKDHSAWTVDHHLEVLNLTGALGDELYSSLMNLKSKRNKMLHDQVMPTHKDAMIARNVATALLREVLPSRVHPFCMKTSGVPSCLFLQSS
jgi:hypothetical protein